jgi:hypothetical protein
MLSGAQSGRPSRSGSATSDRIDVVNAGSKQGAMGGADASMAEPIARPVQMTPGHTQLILLN